MAVAVGVAKGVAVAEDDADALRFVVGRDVDEDVDALGAAAAAAAPAAAFLFPARGFVVVAATTDDASLRDRSTVGRGDADADADPSTISFFFCRTSLRCTGSLVSTRNCDETCGMRPSSRETRWNSPVSVMRNPVMFAPCSPHDCSALSRNRPVVAS